MVTLAICRKCNRLIDHAVEAGACPAHFVEAALKEVAALTVEWRVMNAPFELRNSIITADLLHAEIHLGRALRLLEAVEFPQPPKAHAQIEWEQCGVVEKR